MKQSSLLVATALVSALAAAPVFAQTANSTSAPTTSPSTASASSSSNASGHFMAQSDANEWRMTKLKGLNVYNNNNEKLGSIDDLLVDKSGQIKAAVIGVGGFLGIGDHQVAVPFTDLQFVYDNNSRGPNTAANTNGNNTLGNQAHNNAASPTTTGTAATGLGAPATTGKNANTATSTTPAGTTMANNNAAGTSGRRDDAPDHAVLNATKDQLKSAPQFKWNG
jgi:sporulation protein YlmC with PRC-barrel domain